MSGSTRSAGLYAWCFSSAELEQAVAPAGTANHSMQIKNRKQRHETLDVERSIAKLGAMAERKSRAGSNRKHSQVDLGGLLAHLRVAKGLSLRQVEEATGKAVSNAYLSQLEKGKIRKPSPHVLHSLAEVYAVPYEALMERAGYLPSEDGGGRRRRLAAFAIDDLTAEEEEELLKYLAFLRFRTTS